MITISSKAHRTSKTCKSFLHRLTVGKHHPKRIIKKISQRHKTSRICSKIITFSSKSTRKERRMS
jgi:hypothetical protein